MVYQLPSDLGYNFTSGYHSYWIYLVTQVPNLMPLLLFSFFTIVLLSGYFLEKRSSTKADFSQWFLIAGFLTSTLAMVLFLTVGIINLDTIIVTLAVTLVGALWFFNSKNP